MRKLLVLLLGAGLAAVIACGVWVTSVRNRKWADLERRVEELRREAALPPLTRLPLGRPLVPGNAWDDYIAANPHVPGQPYRNIGGNLRSWIHREPKVGRPEAEALVSEFAASIESMRKGARREVARIPSETPARDVYSAQDAVWLCLAKARFLAEAGETEAALDLLVDVCVYGRDVTGFRYPGATTSGLHTMELAFREMKDLLEKRALPRAEAQRLAQALQVLDEHYPDSVNDIRADLLQFGLFLQQEDRADAELMTFSDGERSRRSWRYCFSSRLQAAAEFSVAEDYVRRAFELRGKPWSEEGPGNSALLQEKGESKDLLLARGLGYLGAPQWATSIRGVLRLLRAGTHYKAEGVVPTIEDPVGDTIRSRITETTILLWRRPYVTGVDWEPRPAPRNYGDNAALELPR